MRTVSLLKTGLKYVSAAADRVTPTSGIVVLIYHRVGGRTSVSVDLARPLFEEQLRVLAADYRVVSLDQAAIELEEGVDVGRPTVVITFDDGTADFADEAVPLLAEYGLPATMFLATSFIEDQIDFPDDGRPMSWAAARDALDSGVVTYGSHTHSHLLLDRISPSAAAQDLDRSIELLRERVGVDPQHFAYPKALLAAPEVEPEVRRRFTTAVVARTRPNRPGAVDLHRLTRSPVQTEDGVRWFRHKADGGMRLEDDLRGLVNRWRYRHVTR